MTAHQRPSGDGKTLSSSRKPTSELIEQFDLTGVNPFGSSSPRHGGFPPYSPMIRSLSTVVPSTVDRPFGFSVVARYAALVREPHVPGVEAATGLGAGEYDTGADHPLRAERNARCGHDA